MLYCGVCGNEDVHVEHPLFLKGPSRNRDILGTFFPERRKSYAI